MATKDPVLATYIEKWIEAQPALTSDRSVFNGLVGFADANTPMYPLAPNTVQRIKDTISQELSIPTIKDFEPEVYTEASFIIPANETGTDKITVTYNVIFSGFTLHQWEFADYDNSQAVFASQMFRTKLDRVLKAMGKRKEETIFNHLNTYKSQYLRPDTVGAMAGYSWANDTVSITLDAQKNTSVFHNLDTLMKTNDLVGGLKIVVNPTINALFNDNRLYSEYNSKNNKQDMSGMPDTFYSNNVANANGSRFTGFLAEEGCMALISSVLPQYRNFTKVNEMQFGVSAGIVPYLNDEVMTIENTRLYSAAKGHPLSMINEYGFVYRFAIIKEYNDSPTTKAGKVLKFIGATS